MLFRSQIRFEVEGRPTRLLISNYVGETVSLPSPMPPTSPPEVEEVDDSPQETKELCFGCGTSANTTKNTSQQVNPSANVICDAIVRRLHDINNAKHHNNDWVTRDDSFDEFYQKLSREASFEADVKRTDSSDSVFSI